MNIKSSSLLKVSLKTAALEDYPKLIDGLKKLNKSDPSVEIFAQENGDVILSTCGEVHLERCIRDLEETLAKVPIKVSEPIISFRETLIYRNWKEINYKKLNKEQENKEKEKTYKENEANESEEEEKKDYGEGAEIINVMEDQKDLEEMRFILYYYLFFKLIIIL